MEFQMELIDIATTAGNIIAGSASPVTSVANATTEVFKLINKLTEDDPVKQAKALREYVLLLVNIAKEVRDVADGTDVSDRITDLVSLLDGK